MKKSTKNRILFTSILLMLILSYPYKHKYKSNYVILDESDDAFASYSEGLIYIGNEEFLKSVDACDGDILILDERNLSDPNICIYNSCEIKDKDLRNDILEVVCFYEEMYPSKWDRSIESMRLEWLCHNASYYFNYETERSSEVDLNNEDEEKYKSKVLNRLLRI